MPIKRYSSASSANKRFGNMRFSYFNLAVSIIALVIAAFALFNSMHQATKIIYINNTNRTNQTKPVTSFNISSPLITPQLSLADSPVITANQSFGNRLTSLNQQLNATELSVINNAPISYFEKAGEMYLNNTLNNTVGAQIKKVPLFIVNGKPTVIYLGSITCIFCGENRWAMALALSRFGSFSQLYKGYSAIQDSDVPTLYWSPASYNRSTVDLGSFYNSSYINFIAIEDTAPIRGGFALQPVSVMQSEINATGNLAYADAFKLIVQLNNFQGTPYTIWGTNNAGGADAIDFGNSVPSSGTLPLEYMSHAAVLQQLAKPANQFSYTEYAAADLYIAMTCTGINNTAPVCSLPAITKIEKLNGY